MTKKLKNRSLIYTDHCLSSGLTLLFIISFQNPLLLTIINSLPYQLICLIHNLDALKIVHRDDITHNFHSFLLQ